MSQKWYVSHAETIAQNVIGLAIGYILLHLWGLAPTQIVSLQIAMFITSYIRSYCIRRVFNNLEKSK